MTAAAGVRAAPKKKSLKKNWTDRFRDQLDRARIGHFRAEYRFHPDRMWRFDFADPERKIAIEIDGAAFGRAVICGRCHAPVFRSLKDGRRALVREGGRHSTGAGLQADHEKFNAAVLLGWRVLRFTTTQVRDGYAIATVLSITKNF